MRRWFFEPADGSVLTLPPKMVQLNFNEGVTPAVIGVIDAGGKARDVATCGRPILADRSAGRPAAGHANRQLSRGLAGRSSRGGIDGVFNRRRDRGRAAGENPLAVLIWLARIGVYLGLFVGVGGAFFAAWIGQGLSGSAVSRGALAIGLVSAVASLGLQGLDLLNLPLGGIVTSAPWAARSRPPSGRR